MSHFVAFAMIDKEKFDTMTPEQRKEHLDKLLAPYDERLKVEEYEKKCHCVGDKAWDRIQYEIKEEAKKIHQKAQKATGKLNPFDSEYLRFIEEPIRQLERKERELFEAQPDKDDPDPDCSTCEGTGVFKTTYNPDSKWDWWVIGGRWAGYKTEHQTYSDVFDVRTLIEEEIHPYALLTENGDWYARGEMGWFGVDRCRDSKETQEQRFQALYERHRHCYAVVLDLHI